MFSVINKSQWDTICVSRISNLSNDPLILKKVPTILFVCYYCSAINLSIISNYSNLLKNNWGTNIVYVQVQKKKKPIHIVQKLGYIYSSKLLKIHFHWWKEKSTRGNYWLLFNPFFFVFHRSNLGIFFSSLSLIKS